MFIDESPILRKISKKTYEKAQRKYQKQYGAMWELNFFTDYKVVPIYNVGLLKRLQGAQPIRWEYYKITGWQRNLYYTTAEAKIVKQLYDKRGVSIESSESDH